MLKLLLYSSLLGILHIQCLNYCFILLYWVFFICAIQYLKLVFYYYSIVYSIVLYLIYRSIECFNSNRLFYCIPLCIPFYSIFIVSKPASIQLCIKSFIVYSILFFFIYCLIQRRYSIVYSIVYHCIVYCSIQCRIQLCIQFFSSILFFFVIYCLIQCRYSIVYSIISVFILLFNSMPLFARLYSSLSLQGSGVADAAADARRGLCRRL